jgi:hypothetical protein
MTSLPKPPLPHCRLSRHTQPQKRHHLFTHLHQYIVNKFSKIMAPPTFTPGVQNASATSQPFSARHGVQAARGIQRDPDHISYPPQHTMRPSLLTPIRYTMPSREPPTKPGMHFITSANICKISRHITAEYSRAKTQKLRGNKAATQDSMR